MFHRWCYQCYLFPGRHISMSPCHEDVSWRCPLKSRSPTWHGVQTIWRMSSRLAIATRFATRWDSLRLAVFVLVAPSLSRSLWLFHMVSHGFTWFHIAQCVTHWGLEAGDIFGLTYGGHIASENYPYGCFKDLQSNFITLLRQQARHEHEWYECLCCLCCLWAM